MGDKVINDIIKILNSKLSILKLSYLIIFLSCDESPPFVQLIYPIDGMTLNEATTLQAEAYDNDGDGKIMSVKFFIDDELIVEIDNPNNDGIWEYPFNPSAWAYGNHNIYAKAYDFSGNEGKSNYINITIPEGIESTTNLYEPGYNEELVNVSMPTFSWYSIVSVFEYDFEIYKFSNLDEYDFFNDDLNSDPNFDQVYNYIVTDTLQENDGMVYFTIEDTLCGENSGFYWRIRSRTEIADNINFGDWSQPSIFKIKGPEGPNLAEPISGNDVMELPTFKWINVPYALDYNIIISRTIYDNDMCNGNIDLCFDGNNAINDTITRVSGEFQEYIPQNQVTIESGKHYWKVRSRNGSNIWGEWSSPGVFYMQSPDQINMIYPQNGQRISSTNQPNFNWDLNEAVEQYEFNLYSDLGYQKTVITDSDFFDMSFDDDTLETEVIYFCKVRGSNNTNAWNDWSEIIQFRITGPPAPNILAPLENQVFTENDVLKFIWDEPDASTDSIQIQINYDDNSFKFDTTISAQLNTLEIPHLESRNFFYKKQSYYRIRSKNNLGYLGAWSNCVIDNNGNEEHCNDIDYIQFYVRPDTPQQIYPLEFDDENNLIELIAQPTFSWDVSSGYDDLEFKIQIADNLLFRTNDIIVEEIVSGIEFNTSFNDFEDFQNRSLYWRVKSILYTDFGDIVEGNWSDTNLDNEDIDPASFRAIKPSNTNLQFPENQMEINENIQFNWQEIYGVENYQILVSSSPYFNDDDIVLNNIIDEVNLINPEFLNELMIGEYHWKVRGKSGLGIWGDYSDSFSFYANKPDKVNLLYPNNQSFHYDLNLTDFITFEWESNEVEKYHLEITNKSSEVIFSDSTISSTNFSIILDSLDCGTHSWRVKVANNFGIWSDWSDASLFWIPYILESGSIVDVPSQNFEISKYPITNEQYITFLNEAYHDSLEYIVIRDHYIKGHCPETGEGEYEEQIFAKRATSNDIGEYNLPKIKWNSVLKLFYFEGSNQQLDFEDHPMVFVSWCGALGFAKHYNIDIPSKIEWEETASTFGWNDIELNNSNFNFLDSGDLWDNGTTPVNEYDNKVSSDIKDMLGNTCEWVINNSLNDSNTMCKGLSFKNLILDNIDNFPDTEIINGKTSVYQDIGFRIIKRY